MATNMLGWLLPPRNSSSPKSAWGEKANGYMLFPRAMKPLTDVLTVYLMSAALLFAIGQIFQYVISTHICTGTSGKIDGALFETLFTLLSVVMIFVFWSSITEDDWPMPTSGENTYT